MKTLFNFTLGVDLGDKQSAVCIIDPAGNIQQKLKVTTTMTAFKKFFSPFAGNLVAIENGTHSPWVSHLLEKLGCRVLVGNARKLPSIWRSPVKTDFRDAETLGRIARFDPNLLYPIYHRNEGAQADLAIIKARDMLVQTRSGLINYVRGAVKSMGARIPDSSAEAMAKRAKEHMPEILKPALLPLLSQIEQLNKAIREYDRQIENLSKEKYKETEVLRQVVGVGPITALAFVLTLEDPTRFQKSREVGPALGMVPRKDQSGEMDKQLRITKCGNIYLRQLLVNCAHYILGPFGPDCELKRFGNRISQHGGKMAKKRAVVAVARKLAVLLHRLWVTGEAYDPFYNQPKAKKAA
ncbi:IS110 family RNA-guided transposase [Desulfonatronum parangueonense]